MELNEENLKPLTSRGLIVSIYRNSCTVMKPNEVPGNFVEGYEDSISDIVDGRIEEIMVLNSPCSHLDVRDGKYYFWVLDYEPGLGPDDFSNEFDSLGDCLQDILDYYFGDSARMNKK